MAIFVIIKQCGKMEITHLELDCRKATRYFTFSVQEGVHKMVTLLAVIHIIACLGLITLVLMQDSKGGGVFTSQATSNSVLGAGGATSLAQTMTKVLGGVFAITCIGLSVMSARSEKSVIDTMPTAAAPLTTSPLPGTPTTPKTPTETVPVANDATAAPATAPATQAAPATEKK